jgi:hypothetical protein
MAHRILHWIWEVVRFFEEEKDPFPLVDKVTKPSQQVLRLILISYNIFYIFYYNPLSLNYFCDQILIRKQVYDLKDNFPITARSLTY